MGCCWYNYYCSGISILPRYMYHYIAYTCMYMHVSVLGLLQVLFVAGGLEPRHGTVLAAGPPQLLDIPLHHHYITKKNNTIPKLFVKQSKSIKSNNECTYFSLTSTEVHVHVHVHAVDVRTSLSLAISLLSAWI